MLLLCKAWREDPPGSIPDDDRVLARWARLEPDRWTACRTGVLAAFTLGTDTRWHQKRMRREYQKLRSFKQQRIESAKIAAKARWNGNASRMRDACGEQCDRNADRCLSSSLSSSTKKIPTQTLPAEGLFSETICCLKKLSVPDDAAQAQEQVAKTLSDLGYSVEWEHFVPDRGDGRRGKIDLYAISDDLSLAIEIDRGSPREKSLVKLRSLIGVKRLILLRAPVGEVSELEGIDAVLPIGPSATRKLTELQRRRIADGLCPACGNDERYCECKE